MSGELVKASKATDKIVEALEECIERLCNRHDYDHKVITLSVLHAFVDGMSNDETLANSVLQLIGKANAPVTDEKLLDGYENDEQSLTDEIVADSKEREDDNTDA